MNYTISRKTLSFIYVLSIIVSLQYLFLGVMNHKFLIKNIINKEVKVIINRNNLLEARSSNTDLIASMTYFVPI